MPKLVVYPIFLLLSALIWSSAAFGGAWPREVGGVFLSFGTSFDVNYDVPGNESAQMHTLFAEYGLRPKLTLGLDAQLTDQGDYSAILFLRRPIIEKSQSHRFAFQGGVGIVEKAKKSDYLIQGGFAWGKGIETKFGSGWMSLDSSLEYHLDSADVVTKADFTFGVKPSTRTKLMVQVQTGAYPGSDPYVRFAPSIAREFGKGRHLVLEGNFGVLGESKAGMKLGTWLEF